MTDDRFAKPANGGRGPRAAWARLSGAATGGSRRIALIGLTACLCLLTAGVALAVFSSPGSAKPGQLAGAGSSPGAAQSTPAQSAAAVPSHPATTPATTPPKVAADKVTGSILTWPPRLNRQMRHWKAGPGGATLAKVETQLGTAMQAAGVKLYVQMRVACGALASDTSRAQAGPPIPAHAMQRLYVKALAGTSHAAANCQAAISVHASGDETTEVQLDRALLSRTRLELAAMSRKLYRATAELRSLHG